MKNRQAIIDHSEAIGGWSNGNYETGGSNYRYTVDLYRHRDGKYFLASTGGAAMASGETCWISEDAARRFLTAHANDPISGYGYTEAEADDLLAGRGAKGTRDFAGTLPPRPEIDEFRGA